MVHKLGWLRMDPILQKQLIILYDTNTFTKNIFFLSQSQKLNPKAAEMQAPCINGANNNVPYWEGKGPLLLEAFSEPTGHQRHTVTYFQHKFGLHLLHLPAATGAPRLIYLPHANHWQQQQIISTNYNFGTCSHQPSTKLFG